MKTSMKLRVNSPTQTNSPHRWQRSTSGQTWVFMRIVVIVGALFGLGACNTLDGVGQDVEQAGEAVQDAAR